jgi:hypothetical protein
VHPATVCRLAETPFELVAGGVERFVEVLGTRLAAYYWSPCAAGDFDVLTAAVLTPIALVMELYVGSDDLLVEAFDLAELLADVQSEMLWDLDVAPVYHDVHAPSTVGRSVRTKCRAGLASLVGPRGSGGTPTRSGPDNASREFAYVPDGRHAGFIATANSFPYPPESDPAGGLFARALIAGAG